VGQVLLRSSKKIRSGVYRQTKRCIKINQNRRVSVILLYFQQVTLKCEVGPLLIFLPLDLPFRARIQSAHHLSYWSKRISKTMTGQRLPTQRGVISFDCCCFDLDSNRPETPHLKLRVIWLIACKAFHVNVIRWSIEMETQAML
jgi:hypothetical protein